MTPGEWLMVVAVVGFTLVAAILDYRTKKLPNWLTVPGFVAALVYHAVMGASTGGWTGLGWALANALGGFAVGFGILLVLWLIGSGGAGDVKLMGALGAWLGAAATLQVFLVSTVFVLLGSLLVLTANFLGRGMQRTKDRYLSTGTRPSIRGASSEELDRQRRVHRRLMPYGVPVALATWLVLAWTHLQTVTPS